MQTCPHHRRVLHVPWVVILVWLMMLLPSVSALCFHWSMESLTGRASRGRSGYFRLGLVFELVIRHSLGHAVAVSCSLSGLAVATDECNTTEVAPGCPSQGQWVTFASIPPEFADICESRPCFYPRSLFLWPILISLSELVDSIHDRYEFMIFLITKSLGLNPFPQQICKIQSWKSDLSSVGILNTKGMSEGFRDSAWRK